MASVLTLFRIQLPLFADGTTGSTAVNSFITSMSTLTTVTQYVAITGSKSNPGQITILEGLITTAQQVTALGFLTTLNTSLGFNVLCTINSVTSEP